MSSENGDDNANGIVIDLDINRILRIVKKIQDNRNRACYQNILTEITMEIYRPIIDDLLERNVLININKDKTDNESFKLGDTHIENKGVSTDLKDDDGISLVKHARKLVKHVKH